MTVARSSGMDMRCLPANSPASLIRRRAFAWQEGTRAKGLISFGKEAGEQTVLIAIEELAEGYGVANYTTAILRSLRKEPINPDSITIRRVLIGGVKGREISCEIEGADGTVRQIYWVTQVGPRGFGFITA